MTAPRTNTPVAESTPHLVSKPFSVAEWVFAAQAGQIPPGLLVRAGPLGHREELLSAILNHKDGLPRELWVALCRKPWFVTRAELEGLSAYQLERLDGWDPHEECLKELRFAGMTMTSNAHLSIGRIGSYAPNSTPLPAIRANIAVARTTEELIRWYSG